MSFNFGATPFKYSFPQGAIPIANAKNTKTNCVGQTSVSSGDNSTRIPDAPKAIIVEVIFIIVAAVMFLNLKYFNFFSLPEN